MSVERVIVTEIKNDVVISTSGPKALEEKPSSMEMVSHQIQLGLRVTFIMTKTQQGSMAQSLTI